MITELLSIGEDNAITGKDLATYLGCDVRRVTRQIEYERRNGQPICATNGRDYPGYYLAEDTADLLEYCKKLKHREQQIYETRKALLASAYNKYSEV